MKKQENMDELPPFLRDMKEKGDGFTIPDGYFDTLEDAVFTRLESAGGMRRPVLKADKKPSLMAAYIRPRAAMAVAAALTLVLAAVWFIRRDTTAVPVDETVVSAELTQEDVEAYLLQNAHDFDPEQLVVLEEEEQTPSPAETPKKPRSGATEVHPDDLDQIIDEMTDEELEEIL